MQDYLLIWLNHKYGLKRVVIEQCNQIINALKIHTHDQQVQLFTLVLKNQIDQYQWSEQ